MFLQLKFRSFPMFGKMSRRTESREALLSSDGKYQQNSNKKRRSSLSSRKLLFNSQTPCYLLFILLIELLITQTNPQPVLNIPDIPGKLAIWFRAKSPQPTSFTPSNATSTASPSMNAQQSQQQFQFQPHFIQQPPLQEFQVQQTQQVPSNIYPTSSEQLQNLIAVNKVPLSQGIPVVSMDQNSITIMTPAVPNQIMPPQNNIGTTGQEGVFVAQPIHFNISMSPEGHYNQNNVQSFNNLSPHHGPIVHVMPPTNYHTEGNMNLLPGGIPLNHPLLSTGPDNVGIQFQNHHNLMPSGSGNIAVATLPAAPNHFPSLSPKQQQQQSPFPTGGILLNPHPPAGNGPAPPPPPPPIPKNFKGPAIIAVPKQQILVNPTGIMSHPSHYFGSSVGNTPPLVPQAFPPTGLGAPMIPPTHQPIASIHQVPVTNDPVLNPLQPLHTSPPSLGLPPSHHLISLPENALQLNKTRDEALLPALNHSLMEQQYFFQVPNNHVHQNLPGFVYLKQNSGEKFHPGKVISAEQSQAHLSSDLKGNQRKRQPNTVGKLQASDESQKQNSARGNIFRHKPSSSQRTTQIPLPASEVSDNAHNAIDHNKKPPSVSDYSLSTIINLPSTTISGTFEYPDPPTPPNIESMNAIKDPSRHEDSPEVGVHVSSSRDHKRLKSGNAPFKEIKRVTTTSSSIFGTTAAQASNQYNSITVASASPSTSRAFDVNVGSNHRDVTTYPTSIFASETPRKGKISRNKVKYMNFDPYHHQKPFYMSEVKGQPPKLDFRPSPELHSFEDIETGRKSYITIAPIGSLDDDEKNIRERRDREQKSLFEASESNYLPYETGFRPINHYYARTLSSLAPPSTTKESLYFDLVRKIVQKNPLFQGSNFVTSADGLTVTYPYDKTTAASSSEKIENWRIPDSDQSLLTPGNSSPIYHGTGPFGPPNCSKFHRFGFCPINSGYPANSVEKIAKSCSALLSHLIAPLPKADVRYDVIVAKNGSMLKEKSAKTTGWQWKTFKGTPICETKEVKVIPGWAKNEQGEWLVILQTKSWKQQAMVTLCAPQGTLYNCNGNTTKTKESDDCTPIKIKCVQRFTAQRLAVLDPENTDRCPVLRSVFLPSACVCLNDNVSKKSGPSASSEELSASSSNLHVVRVWSNKSSKKDKSRSKGRKGKGDKSKKSSSKKHKASLRHNKARSPKGTNAHSLISSEEENKSDMLDVAADSSTSGLNMNQLHSSWPPATINFSGKDDHVTSSPEDDDNDVDDHDQPQADHLKGKGGAGEYEDNSNQNEVDANEDSRSTEKSRKEEEFDRLSTTVTYASDGDSNTISPDGNESASEDDTEN